MLEDIRQLIDSYHDWLRDKTSLRQIEDWVEITTPCLDRHNDYIQIYARRANAGYILTDDGFTLEDLEQGGCSLDTPKRQALLKQALAGFGVQLSGNELQVQAAVANFPMRKHNLLQAMLAVNDMFYLATPVVSSLFEEDAADWLDALDIRYTPQVKFTGKTGFDYVFDFVIPRSRQQPERIIQAINNPDRNSAQAAIMAWHDTRGVRPAESRAYVLLNDQDRPVPASVPQALQNYDVHPVIWSERGGVQEELAA